MLLVVRSVSFELDSRSRSALEPAMIYSIPGVSSLIGLRPCFAARLIDGPTTLVNDLWPLKSEVSPHCRSAAKPAMEGTPISALP